jgi:hypothetical protein
MQEIIIDGVNLNEMKAKHDALQAEMNTAKGKIRQGASKYIAENISKARKVLDEMLETEEAEKVDHLAQDAYDLLSAAKFVSAVSGVAFYLPYYDRQGGYCPDGQPYTHQFEDSDNEHLSCEGVVGRLWYLLDGMESDVADWNTSYC